MEQLGGRIRKLRESRNMTQTELSEILGMKTYTTVSKWEKNENFPKGKDLKKLAEIFNVTSDYLLGLSDTELGKITTQNKHHEILTLCNQLNEEKLKQLILSHYSSVKSFAEENGMPYSTVRSILERGIMNANVENAIKICSALGIRPEIFSYFLETSKGEPEILTIYNQLEEPKQEKVLDYAKEQLEEQNSSKIVSIFDKPQDDEDYITDYVEGLVAAGHGTFQEDNLHMEVRLRAEDVPEDYDTIAKVAGDSMEPLIEDNDLLFIKVTSQVDINSIGIFQVNDKNFVKKLKRDYDGSWYLQSLNSGYEEIHLTENDDIRTIGVVVDIYREG